MFLENGSAEPVLHRYLCPVTLLLNYTSLLVSPIKIYSKTNKQKIRVGCNHEGRIEYYEREPMNDDGNKIIEIRTQQMT